MQKLASPPARPKLISAPREAHLFWRIRLQTIRTMLMEAVTTARLRLGVLAILSLVFWVGLYFLFYEGFLLLQSAVDHAPTRAQTVQAIYNIFFVALLAMLTVSSAIILFSGLYRSDDVAMLLTLPITAERITLHKFQEALVFSCWGFILLGSPMLIAYGVVAQSPWWYYTMLLPFMVAYVFIPAGLGGVLCMVVVYFLPTVRVHALVLVSIALVAAAVALGWSLLFGQEQDIFAPVWFNQMLGRLRFAEQRFLPSWWLSSGLLEAAHPTPSPENPHPWRESVLFLTVLMSNAMIAVLAVMWTGRWLLRGGYGRLQGITSPAKRTRGAWLDDLALWIARPFPLSLRLLLVKDLRLFRRDPVQWTQVAIFFGLLGLYFINIRRFQPGEPLTGWMNVIGFLNLGVVGLILSTFTTRFIFPMISLEGRRFWILGSLPIRRETVLWSKFVFACGGAIIPCSLLIFLSDMMLNIASDAPLIALVHQITCWVLCVGLSAIAVGLGARLPNLRESSPSKIAAGFGGTLNLVLSGIFILAVVFSTAVPCYWLLEAQRKGIPQFLVHVGLGSSIGVAIGVGIAVVLGLLATVIPLRMGMKAFRELEF